VVCCCCLKSKVLAFRRAVFCFRGDMWIPSLDGKQNGHPRTGSDERGYPKVSPSPAQTWLCFSLPTDSSAGELPRGTRGVQTRRLSPALAWDTGRFLWQGPRQLPGEVRPGSSAAAPDRRGGSKVLQASHRAALSNPHINSIATPVGRIQRVKFLRSVTSLNSVVLNLWRIWSGVSEGGCLPTDLCRGVNV